MISSYYQRGFTLIEAIIAMVLTGILAGVVAVFIATPVKGYFESVERARLADAADTLVRRIDRELRKSVPNSVRLGTSSQCLEHVSSYTGGRYRGAPDCSSGTCAGNVLDTGSATSTFDVLSAMSPVPAVGDTVVVYNTGANGSNVYDGDNTATISAATIGAITLSSPKQFPFDSPERRFQVVAASEQAVSYFCENAGTDAAGDGTGVLYRASRYGFNPATPTCAIPGTAQRSILATKVSACAFTYDANGAGRVGVVGLNLSITKNNETVSLYHETAVNNLP